MPHSHSFEVGSDKEDKEKRKCHRCTFKTWTLVFTAIGVVGSLVISIYTIVKGNPDYTKEFTSLESRIAALEALAGFSGGSIDFSRVTNVVISDSMIPIDGISGVKISSLPSGKISGNIPSSQVIGLTFNQITGQLSPAQILDNSITSSKLSGTIPFSQLSGQISATQILDNTIQTSKLVGSVDNLISSIPVAKISGSLMKSWTCSDWTFSLSQNGGLFTIANSAPTGSTTIHAYVSMRTSDSLIIQYKCGCRVIMNSNTAWSSSEVRAAVENGLQSCIPSFSSPVLQLDTSYTLECYMIADSFTNFPSVTFGGTRSLKKCVLAFQ